MPITNRLLAIAAFAGSIGAPECLASEPLYAEETVTTVSGSCEGHRLQVELSQLRFEHAVLKEISIDGIPLSAEITDEVAKTFDRPDNLSLSGIRCTEYGSWLLDFSGAVEGKSSEGYPVHKYGFFVVEISKTEFKKLREAPMCDY